MHRKRGAAAHHQVDALAAVLQLGRAEAKEADEVDVRLVAPLCSHVGRRVALHGKDSVGGEPRRLREPVQRYER